MTEMAPVSRRRFLKRTGGLVVAFNLLGSAAVLAQAPAKPKLPGSLDRYRRLDSWLRINADGTVTVFTGKVELGQGIKTALAQLAAEELDVDLKRVEMVTADTSVTPDEGVTSGSLSLLQSGNAIHQAAAEARQYLLEMAAARLGVPRDALEVADGTVRAKSGEQVTYWELLGGRYFQYEATGAAKPKTPDQYKVVATAVPRLDIPAKMTGGVSYVQDIRLPGMLHGRVVRPPSYGAKLQSLDTAGARKMPGVVKIVRDGSFLAVIAEREEQAIAAADRLRGDAKWIEPATLPDAKSVHDMMLRLPSRDYVIDDRKGTAAPGAKRVEAKYTRPYQAHASIGPSCAVARLTDAYEVWTHSQGVYPLRKSLAELLRVPEDKVRCIHKEGSGCYGHNGADDVAGDAVLLAREVPGRPVRVQWMRADENTWEPFGSAMVMKAAASLDASGNVAEWNYDVWSFTHSTRPESAGRLIAAWHLEEPFPPPPTDMIPQPAGGGDRNAIPLYDFPVSKVVHHFLPQFPLRSSAQRGLGAFGNVFALESFMDELALAAGADPVEFRLRHLKDPRGRDVVQRAADKFGWKDFKAGDGKGKGLAFARYKNQAAYSAVAMEVAVDRASGEVRLVRAVAANDSGQIINPMGITMQVEGGVIQAASWALKEQVMYDRTRIQSADWSTYPILTFPEVPDVTVELINRPGQPYLGTGETTQGPTGAAIANAVFSAVGVRVRDLPLTPDKVKRAIQAKA